jgi:hypothetical protein
LQLNFSQFENKFKIKLNVFLAVIENFGAEVATLRNDYVAEGFILLSFDDLVL